MKAMLRSLRMYGSACHLAKVKIISQKIIFFGMIVSFFLTCPGLLEYAASGAKAFAQINSVPGVKKVLQPEFLDKFNQGIEKVKIVVQLKGFQNFKGLSIADDAVRMKSVQSTIRSRQDRVLNGLDEKQFQLKHRFENILGFSGEATLEGIKKLAGMDEVAVIEEDREMEMHTAEGIPLIGANGLHSLNYYGSGISIAICDSGVDYTHPELGGAPLSSNTKVIGGRDVADGDDDPMPTNASSAHGTACAGIAAGDTGGGYYGGVAPSAKIYALKVFKDNGTGLLSDTAAAWDWCVTHKNDDSSNPILIISNSVGAVDAYQTATCDSGTYSFFATAAATAVSNGMTIFASSGNDGYCDATTAPACNTDVISVGSVYDAAFGQYLPCVSSLSCVSKTASTGCNTGWYATDQTAADVVPSYSNSASFLDIMASANKANTTDMVGSGGYESGNYTDDFGGTSAACPYAAGAGALLQEYAKAQTGSYLTPAELKAKLVTYGDPVTDSKSSITTPRVNVLASALGASVTTTIGSSTTTTTSSGGCPPDYPIDCGNGWCCPSSHPSCGTGSDEGLCFSDGGGSTTTTIGSGLCPDPGYPVDCVATNGGCCAATHPVCCSDAIGGGCCAAAFPFCCSDGYCYANQADCADCPSEIALDRDESKLAELREMRDVRMASNCQSKTLISLYYEHAEEIAELLSTHYNLKLMTANVVGEIAEKAAVLNDHGEVGIERELLKVFLELADEINAYAGPELKRAIKKVKQEIKRGDLFRQMGIKVQ